MRLLYVTASMPFGKGEEFLVAEAQELIRQGLEILVIPRSPEGVIFNGDAQGLGEHSLRRSLCGLSVVSAALLETLRRPFGTARALALLIRGTSVRVLLRNALVFPKALWLARIGRRWHADHLHVHWGRTTATMAMIASELTGIPWSMTLHRGDIADPNLLALKMERAAFTRFISRSGVDIARNAGTAVQAEKTFVIHVGVTMPAVRHPRTVPHDTCVLLCPAQFNPIKGHSYLVAAMGIVKEHGESCRLNLAGEGELREDLQNQVDLLGLSDTVSFLGQVPHEQLLELYQGGNVDIVVLPSIDLGNHMHEGIPVALMEAMAHGIPVVSTATGGIPELLGEGAGMIVAPEDSAALADALEQLIRDPLLRSRVGLAGRRRIEDEFAVERTTAELAARINAVGSSTLDGPVERDLPRSYTNRST